MNTQVIIENLKKDEVGAAAQLLAEAMANNPNHIAIFKSVNPKVLEKQKKMFLMVLTNPNYKVFSAKLNNEIVGIMAYTTSSHCQLKPFQFLLLFAKFINIFGRHLLPVLRWRMLWAKHDYSNRHIHFGPIAVSCAHQGNGIGKALLKHFCAYLQRTQQTGFLETDKIENVNLYESFGFEVCSTDKFLNIPNWFMVKNLN